jgi:hypothetical protein
VLRPKSRLGRGDQCGWHEVRSSPTEPTGPVRPQDQDLGSEMGRHRRNHIFATHAQARRRRAPPRSHGSGTSGSGGRHRRGPAGWLRGRCRWAAARLRTATGVTRFALESEHRAKQRTPWLGLLLWALACAGLFVSLLMQADELDRKPRLAAQELSQAQRPITAYAFVTGELDRVGRLATEFSSLR